jgi:hypothetical protein
MVLPIGMMKPAGSRMKAVLAGDISIFHLLPSTYQMSMLSFKTVPHILPIFVSIRKNDVY